MTKRGDDIATHQIGSQCPDALGMSAAVEERQCKKG